jgi:hypothetical protein
MKRTILLAALAVVLAAAPARAECISGKYVEARTCDVWTGPCFANADFNLAGKNAVLAWKIDKGTLNNVSLDGLGVVAVISASDPLGLEQTGPAKAILIVDEKATPSQRKALIQLVQKQGGKLTRNIVAVRQAAVNVTMCQCKGNVCAEVLAGGAFVKTRCLDAKHDKACGNETAFHPPLAQNVQVRPAAAVESSFRGAGLPETWRDFDRRGAYVGSFEVR